MAQKFEAPLQNFTHSINDIEIPQLGTCAYKGKVRNRWDLEGGISVLVALDRQSAYDSTVCGIPGYGAMRNLEAAGWFKQLPPDIPHHMLSIPHPYAMIVRTAHARLPVEIVWRNDMAGSNTPTSIDHNYRKGRRTIYGLHFPDGLQTNHPFPDGPILTPTTKSDKRDEELTFEQAQYTVDSEFGQGTWQKAVTLTLRVFQLGTEILASRGIRLADTKYEVGIIDGMPTIIDELHTSDSSRLWDLKTLASRLAANQKPDNFDKQTLRDYLSQLGFTGEGPIPQLPYEVRLQLSHIYQSGYQTITGDSFDPRHLNTNPEEVISAILRDPYVRIDRLHI